MRSGSGVPPLWGGSGLRVARALPLSLMCMMVVIDWSAGYMKAFHGGAWLEHADSLRLAVAGFHRTEAAAAAFWLLPGWVRVAAHYGTLVFEIGAPLWFALRVTRPRAVCAGVLLHGMTALMMNHAGFFSQQMAAFDPHFFSWSGGGLRQGRACHSHGA